MRTTVTLRSLPIASRAIPLTTHWLVSLKIPLRRLLKMTTNWLVALLLTAMAASMTGSRRLGEWASFDQVPPVFPALRPRSVSRAAPHQA